MLIDVNNIEKQITTTLEDIARNNNFGAIVGSAKSTLLIKKRFVDIAHSYNLLANGHPEADEQQDWLYDMCWFTYERGKVGYLTSLPFIMECEWRPDPVTL